MNHPGRHVALQALGGILVIAVATLALPAPSTAQYITTGVYTPGGGPPHSCFEFRIPAPPNTPVTIDFSGCQKFWLAANQPMPPGMPPLVVGVTEHTVTTTAGPDGFATFRIVASSENPDGGALPGSDLPCAAVTVAGAPARASASMLFVATFDQDNRRGASVADLAALIADVLLVESTPGKLYLARSDYEHDGDVDAADIGAWVDTFINVLIPGNANGSSCGDPGFACCPLLP